MTLIDTGPLKALYDPRDRNAARCEATLRFLRRPLLTTQPVLTEACYLLDRDGPPRAVGQLFAMLQAGDLLLAEIDVPMWMDAWDLMQRYADAPMDLADASLVVVAAAQGLRRIFTLDAHFHTYRLPDRRAFDVVPEGV